MGASAAMDAAVARPGLFAAMVALSGVPPERSLARAVAHVPTLLIHGDYDQENAYVGAQVWAEELAAAGGRPRFITYVGMDHRVPPQLFTDGAWRQWLFEQRAARALWTRPAMGQYGILFGPGDPRFPCPSHSCRCWSVFFSHAWRGQWSGRASAGRRVRRRRARPGGAGMSGYAPIRDQFLRFGDLRPQGAGEWRGRFRCRRRWPSSTPKSGRWAPWSMSMSARWA